MTGHPTRVSFVGWDAMGHGAVSFAAPQVSAASAIRQSASLQEELAAAAQRAAHEACRTDGERQAVAERHAAHLTAMQEVGGDPGRGPAHKNVMSRCLTSPGPRLHRAST